MQRFELALQSISLNQSETSISCAEGDTKEEIRGITQAFSELTLHFRKKVLERTLNEQTTTCNILWKTNMLAEVKQEKTEVE